MPLKELDICFIENVGNLVCPASYDVGSHLNVVLVSVPEGDDKIEKYPVMFHKADLVIISKTDLLPHFDFDMQAAKAMARRLKPNVDILELSTKDADSVGRLVDWIEFKRKMRAYFMCLSVPSQIVSIDEQAIAELGTVAAMQRLQQVTDNLLRLQRCEINEVMADLHPRYDSHQWAVQLADKHAVKLVTLQHHYAHVLACMAEHRLDQEVLAFSWDGLGLGDDGTLWGSEVPLEEDFPVMGGKTLRINAGVELAFQNGKPIVKLKGVSLMGVPVPNAWLGNLKNVDLVQEFGADPGFWKSFADGVENISVVEGELKVKLKE